MIVFVLHQFHMQIISDVKYTALKLGTGN